MNLFTFYRTPHLIFGEKALNRLPSILNEKQYRTVALFTGKNSFLQSEHWNMLQDRLSENGIGWNRFSVSGEPTVELIDKYTEQCRSESIDAVVSIGGGSVIDTGKAVSAMVGASGSIADYLEGVGSKKPNGKKMPMFAVPTTAGTGSEATKNAVISKTGPNGFKKSLRHDNYVPDVAVIDPELSVTCPPAVTASSGLDAITQLMEAYVSTKASPITDSLVIGALIAAGRSFEKAVTNGEDLQGRADMAYAAFISGVTLANAGLGVVHGIAGPLGAVAPIPHGVACGTLLAVATRLIIERLFINEEENSRVLKKYADIGTYLFRRDAGSTKKNCDRLLFCLDDWTERFHIPKLSDYRIDEELLNSVVSKCGSKNSPVELSKEDMLTLLTERL